MTESLLVQATKPFVPANETERLAALYRYQILDTPPEAGFDRITTLAARLFKTPTVLISLVDESRAWFKSSIGFDAPEVLRDDTICSFAVLTDEPLIVPDTRLDDRFACNPFVQCEPGMRFYAGAPLIDRDGFNLGTLCLLDTVPHAALTAEEEATLVDLAAMVVDELELRLAAQQIARVDAALVEITQGVSRVTGGAFFDELVKHFAKVLGTDYVYIGLVEGSAPKMMKTIATCVGGASPVENRGNIVENLEYRLQDTPCWEAIEQRKLCCYPRNVKAQFPNAVLLQLLPVESYIAMPFLGSDGHVLGVLGVMDGKPLVDVQLAESLLTIFASRIATELERLRSIEKLSESEERLSLALTAADMATWDADLSTGKTIWSAQHFQILGYDPATVDEPTIEMWLSRIHPDDRAAVMAARGAAQRDRSLYQIEYRLVRFDTGAVVWVSSTGRFLDNQVGAAMRFVGVMIDISLRKQTEIALGESQQRLKAIVDALPHPVWVLGADGEFRFSNQQWLDYYGISFPEAIATGWSHVDPDGLATVEQQWRLSMQTGMPYEAEFCWHFDDGSKRCYLSRAEPIRDPSGQIVEWVGTNTDITHLKQVEANLSQSNARFESAMLAVKGTVYEWDLHTQVMYRSRGLFELLGVRAEDASPTNEWWTERVHPDDLKRTQAEFLAAPAGIDSHSVRVREAFASAERLRQRFESEYRVRHAAGHWVHISDRSYFQYDADGKLLKVVGFNTDITERKLAEAELHQSQLVVQRQLTEIEAIYQTAPIGLTIFDRDLRYVRINQRLAEMNGIDIDDHIGRTMREIVPTVADENEPLLYSIFATGEALLNLEISGETAAQPGVQRTWIENCYPLRDETGQIVAINVVVQEITDRKRAELAIQEGNAKLNYLLAAAEFGDWDLNLADGTANRSLQHDRIFGYESLLAEWTYEMFLEHVLPEDRVEVDRKQQYAIANNEPWDFECRIHRTDNQVRWIWASGYVYHNAQGLATRMLGLVADITLRKTTELALADRNQELDSFAHTVSHDLKAPLRAISNLSVWIEEDLDGQLPPDNQRQLQLLRTRVKRMESMIDSLLLYARAGRQEAKLETFDLAELLAEIIDSLAPPEGFTIEIQPSLPILSTKRVFLSQVLTNLISNAIKHHNSVTGHLHILAIEHPDCHEFILKDDGPGIAPEHHEQIFAIFQTFASKDTSDSTGIGLAIVKKIVETEQGTIRLESSLGKGTTFYVTWPKSHS
jgi:PAS domain S-box-containing protein